MFFEEVPLLRGDRLKTVLERYGFTAGDAPRILANEHNDHLDSSTGPDTVFVQPTFIRLPIDISLKVVKAKRVIDLNGLRPVKVNLPTGKVQKVVLCTHGVEVEVLRNVRACERIRWVQTVKRTEPSAASREFVDLGGNGLPFHYITTAENPNQSPQKFEDLPCGISKASGKSLDWTGVLSAIVWTDQRVTIARALSYHLEIIKNHIPFKSPVRATWAELEGQIRILRIGRNQLGHDTGPNLDYRLPPPEGSVNGPKPQPTKRTYTVVSGDTQWKIAQRFYGNGQEWRRIYDANRQVIGPYPGRIFPGQTLVIP